MIVLLQDEVPVEGFFGEPEHLTQSLVLQQVGLASISDGQWLARSTGERRSLAEWLQQGLRPRRLGDTKNRLIIVRKTGDRFLREIIEFLAQQKDYDIAVAIMHVEPSQTDSGIKEISDWLQAARDKIHHADSALRENRPLSEENAPSVSERRLASLVTAMLYIGQEDQNASPIKADQRNRIVADLLRLFLIDDGALSEKLHLFHPTLHQPLFLAFGLRTWWCPGIEWEELARGLAVLELADQLQQLQRVSAQSDKDLQQAPASLLNRTKSLEIPLAEKEVEGQSLRFSERLPHPPANPFTRRFLPIYRELAEARGEEWITTFLREVTRFHGDSHDGIIAKLGEVATAVRNNGQRVFRIIQNELRDRVKRLASFAQVAQMLRVFFPEFSALRTHHSTHHLRACEPASYAVNRVFGSEARDLLRKQCQRIPPMKVVLGGLGFGVFLILLACLAVFAFGSVLLAKFFGGLGCTVILGLTAWATWMSHQAKLALEEYYEDKRLELIEHFRRRLDWVVESTASTVDSQIISDAQSIERVLRAQFEAIYGNWQKLFERLSQTKTEQFESVLQDKLNRVGIGTEEARRIRSEIAGLGVDMTELAVGTVNHEVETRIKRAIPRAAEALADIASKRMAAPEKTHDELFNCVSPQQPPMLASLEENELGQGMTKTFMLPFDYPSSWDGELIASSPSYTTTITVVRNGKLTAPVVWHARRGLPLPAMLRSLKLSRVINQ